MSFVEQSGIAGVPQITPFTGYVSTTPVMPQGEVLQASDPWWGGGEFMYGRAGGSIRAKGVCVCTPGFDSTTRQWRYTFTEAPNTANLGRMIAIAAQAMASGDYGWFQISGLTPVDCQAAVAADTAWAIAAAGQGGAIGNGKQILNSRIVGASTITVAKANTVGQAGALVMQVSDSDGWFPGVFLSGTGVGTNARVVSIDPSGRFVTVDVANTSAGIAGTVTATYNNATIYYNVAVLNRSFAQGQVV